MRAVKEGKNGQNVMSFHGLEFVKDIGRPYIVISSIRNTSALPGATVKEAIKSLRVRQHRLLVLRGNREFHANCIRLKDLPAVDQKLGGKLAGLVEDLLNEYRNYL